ncbi:gag-pol polyprotein [Tanacetum coccineum]
MEKPDRSKTMLLEFAIVKCRSPYNVIMGRTRMRSLGAVGSTIHSMIKFPMIRGVAMMRTSKEALWECRQIERMQSSWKETQWRQHMEQKSKIREQAILRARSIPNQRPENEPMVTEETCEEDTVKEKMDYTSLNKVCAKDMYPFPRNRRGARVAHGIQVQVLLTAPQGTQPSADVRKRQRKDGIPYRGGSILFHPHPKGTKKFYSHTLNNDGQDAWRSEMVKHRDAEETSSWTTEATEAFQKIKRRLAKLPISNTHFLCEPAVAIETCYTLTEKVVLKLVHMTRSLKIIFQKHKVKVVTDGPMEEMLKLFSTEGRLAKWAAKLRTYHVSYVQRKEVEGQVVKKFFEQGEQVLHMSDRNKVEASGSREKPQEDLIPTPMAWRLYMGRKASKEDSGIGMILVIPEEKVYSYVVCLNFYAFEDSMDYEALLVGLVASTGRKMKDLHVFVSSKLLVDQVKGSRIPRTKETKKYIEEIMDATTPFHRLEFLNQEVSVGIKTRPTVEAAIKGPEEARNVEKKAATEKLSPTWEDHNGSN